MEKKLYLYKLVCVTKLVHDTNKRCKVIGNIPLKVFTIGENAEDALEAAKLEYPILADRNLIKITNEGEITISQYIALKLKKFKDSAKEHIKRNIEDELRKSEECPWD